MSSAVNSPIGVAEHARAARSQICAPARAPVARDFAATRRVCHTERTFCFTDPKEPFAGLLERRESANFA